MVVDELAVPTQHFGATGECLVFRPEDFDPSSARPEQPVRVPLHKLRGRCGDVIVLQLRGTGGTTEGQRATLRSLGLGRPRQSSLRWSTDNVTAGYIRAVRHLVGVVSLGSWCHKEVVEESYESRQFGTLSRPGEIWRTLDGAYAGYRSDKTHLLLHLSTEATLAEVLVGLQDCNLEPDLSYPEAWVSIRSSEDDWDSRRGRFTTVFDGLSMTNVVAARFGIKTYGRMARDSEALILTWRHDVQKFYDKDRAAHEVAVVGPALSVARFAALKAAFAEPEVRTSCRLAIPIHVKGRRVEVTI